jgi:hypothetical protein
MAMALHPDRHDGCEVKGDAFKRATEAYQVLSGEIPNTHVFCSRAICIATLKPHNKSKITRKGGHMTEY